MGSSFDRLQTVTSAAGTRQNSFGVATTSSVILENNRRAECVDAMPVLDPNRSSLARALRSAASLLGPTDARRRWSPPKWGWTTHIHAVISRAVAKGHIQTTTGDDREALGATWSVMSDGANTPCGVQVASACSLR